MLSLKNIIKDYPVGDGVVHALTSNSEKMNLLPYSGNLAAAKRPCSI